MRSSAASIRDCALIVNHPTDAHKRANLEAGRAKSDKDEDDAGKSAAFAAVAELREEGATPTLKLVRYRAQLEGEHRVEGNGGRESMLNLDKRGQLKELVSASGDAVAPSHGSSTRKPPPKRQVRLSVEVPLGGVVLVRSEDKPDDRAANQVLCSRPAYVRPRQSSMMMTPRHDLKRDDDDDAETRFERQDLKSDDDDDDAKTRSEMR
eukprot:2180597-Rhodomonas_salina.1